MQGGLIRQTTPDANSALMRIPLAGILIISVFGAICSVVMFTGSGYNARGGDSNFPFECDQTAFYDFFSTLYLLHRFLQEMPIECTSMNWTTFTETPLTNDPDLKMEPGGTSSINYQSLESTTFGLVLGYHAIEQITPIIHSSQPTPLMSSK